MATPTSAARAGKYRFIRALRPFSFPVALVTCLIGVVLAARQVPIHLLEGLMDRHLTQTSRPCGISRTQTG